MTTRALLTAILMLSLPVSEAGATGVIVVAPQARGRAARTARSTHDAILSQLQSIRGLEVTATEGRKARQVLRCLRRTSCIQQAGRRLGVDLVLVSQVRQRGARLTVDLVLISTTSGAEVARDRFQGRRAGAHRRVAAIGGRLVKARSTPAEPVLTQTAMGQPVTQAVDEEAP